METKQGNYSRQNSIARSPTLQTVLMIEKFIDKNPMAVVKLVRKTG